MGYYHCYDLFLAFVYTGSAFSFFICTSNGMVSSAINVKFDEW